MRRGAFVLALVLATLGIAGSANAAGWGPKIALDEGLSTNLSTHMNPDGDVTFLSARLNLSGATEALAQVYKADGTVLSPKTIFSTPGDDGILVLSQNDQAGNIFTLWTTASGGCGCDVDQLFITRLDAEGRPLPQPLTIVDFSDEDKFLLSSSLSVSSDGKVLVGIVVEDDNNGERWVEVYKIDSNLSSTTKISPADYGQGARDIDLATNAQGLTLVAWEVEEPDSSVSVHAQRFDGNGPIGSSVLIDDTDSDMGTMLAAAALDEAGYGTVVVAEDGFGQDGTAVFRWQPDGNFNTAYIDDAFIDYPFGLYALDRKAILAPVANGKVIVALSHDGDNNASETWTFLVNANGDVEQNNLIASSEYGYPASASLKMRPDNTGAIAYMRISEDDQSNVYIGALGYRNIDGDGAPTGSEFLLDQGTSVIVPPIYGNASIATVSPSKVAVSWGEITFGLGYVSQAWGRIYDSTGPSITLKAPAQALAGSEVVLAAEVTDTSPTVVRWQFGDGGTAEGPVQTHTFAKTGSYEVKVVAEDAVGNVSEASTKIKVVTQGQDPVVVSRPQTRITRPPRLRVRVPRAAIFFTSTQEKASFECRVGRGPIAGSRLARLRARGKGGKGLVVRGQWRSCSSPLRLRGLKPARYVVRIRAVGETGLRDLTPAVVRFRTVGPRRQDPKTGPRPGI